MARALTILPHPHQVWFESFGVRIGVSANDSRVVERLPRLPPAEARPCDPSAVEHHVDVTTTDGLRFEAKYDLYPEPVDKQIDDDIWVAGDADLDLVLAMVEAHVHDCVALNAPDHLFLRGGAVLYRGRAIVVAGEALSGKTALVDALVQRGATAYSDEYAVFDRQGRLHPYTKPSLLDGGPAEAAQVEPSEAATIAITAYRPGAEWRPQRLSRGESVLALLSHAVAGDERPKETMSAISRVLSTDPVVLRGERGEADAMASALLADAALERSGAA